MRFLILLLVTGLSFQSIALSSKMSKEEIAQRQKKYEIQRQKREAYELNMLKQLNRSCNQDSDCEPTSCFGAVNKNWLKTFKEAESLHRCSDGCVGWNQSYKCIEKRCTTVQHDGKVFVNRCNR